MDENMTQNAAQEEVQEVPQETTAQPPVKANRWYRGIWWKLPLCLLLVLAVTAGVYIYRACRVWYLNDFSLSLTMHGDREIMLEYGETFQDPGADAVFQGTLLLQDPQLVEVTTKGEVNSTVLGTYDLAYKAKHTEFFHFGQLDFYGTDYRRIHVVDTASPVITLVDVPGSFTFPGQTYVEEGFTANDNYDGDITANVERTATDETVTYRVTDSSGNTTEVVRTIFYNDPVPPTLTLLGEPKIQMWTGDKYVEAGFTAEDNCDGDITQRVTVDGQLDTKNAGTYTLTYSVTDSYGNTVTATRTVEVKKMPVLAPVIPDKPVKPTGKVIYLTFDDGPSAHTPKLLDILAKHNVKATFFVVKNGNSGMLARMAREGHTVAMHSATHNYDKIYASEGAYLSDLQQIQNLILDKTGKTSTFVRFPGGGSNTVSRFNPGIMTRLAALLKDMGYKYFDWNVDSKDAGGATSAYEVYCNVANGIGNRKSSVVLQHDTKGFSVNAVEMIIQWGKANGYTFLPIDSGSPTCHHTIRN